MKKIIVIGCPGSGKSTFSKTLHKTTGISLYHLDMMRWNAEGTKIDRTLFLEKLSNAMQKNEWIIDGNYGSTMEMRLQACDTVFFLDYPLDVCLEGIKERKGKPRTDLPWIESENEEYAEFVEFIKNYNVECRPKVMELLEKYSDKDIYIFNNRNEADNFLNKIKEKRIQWEIILTGILLSLAMMFFYMSRTQKGICFLVIGIVLFILAILILYWMDKKDV